MKKSVLIAVFLFLSVLVYNSNAACVNKPLYSTVSTSFVISKTVKCDKVEARFLIYAEGDNYAMALKRLSKMNNDFLKLLRKLFPNENIKTSGSYGYSNEASLNISIDTKKIGKIPDVLRYIANNNFQYKTGIKPVYIKFGVSSQLKKSTYNDLFKEALDTAKVKLKIVNDEFSGGYEISNLDVGYNAGYPVLYAENRLVSMYKGASKSIGAGPNIQTSPGSIKIDIRAKVDMIKKLSN